MTSAYSKAYAEVLEIISHFPKEEYDKIPKEKIKFYENNMDKDYAYKINTDQELSKQYISKEANAILVSLFRDYFATEKQKEVLGNLLNKNQKELEKEKREKYNPDNIFKKKDEEKIREENTSIIEYKESFFTKFTNFIKKLLNWK